MSYYDGFTPTYTFRLQIEREDRMVLDTAITARAEQSEITKAKEHVQRLLAEFVPAIQIPEQPTEVQEPEASSKPESSLPPKKAPMGAKGLFRLRCPECGKTFNIFLRERQSTASCRCGHTIDLTAPLARYRFTCPYCEKETFGSTNLEDPDITIRCKCRGYVDLQWVPKMKEYRN